MFGFVLREGWAVTLHSARSCYSKCRQSFSGPKVHYYFKSTLCLRPESHSYITAFIVHWQTGGNGHRLPLWSFSHPASLQQQAAQTLTHTSIGSCVTRPPWLILLKPFRLTWQVAIYWTSKPGFEFFWVYEERGLSLYLNTTEFNSYVN